LTGYETLKLSNYLSAISLYRDHDKARPKDRILQ
jgi:hypothetical protein